MDTTQTPPRARVDEVVENYYGTDIADPYRWMEDTESEESTAWLQAQDAHARATLAGLPERDALRARIAELGDASSTAAEIAVEAGRVFYLRRDPGENMSKLVVRVSPDAEERVLVDPNRMAGDPHHAIDWYGPSGDGRHVAYGLSRGGSEDSVLHVIEVDTARVLDEAITRTRWNSIVWLRDNRSFLYTRFPDVPDDAPPQDRFINPLLHLHRLGSDAEADPAVLGHGVDERVPLAPEDSPHIHVSPRSEWMIAAIGHGVLREMTLYVAPLASLDDPASIPWKKIAGVDDGVEGFEIVGTTVYLKTHRDAPRYRVVATSVENPDFASAHTVVPETKAVIKEIVVSGDYLLTRDMDGGPSRLRKVPLSGGSPELIALPFEGAINEIAAEAEGGPLYLQLASWTVSPGIYRCDVAEGTVADTGWIPPSSADFSDIEAHEVFAPSKDGTLVPLSIVHRRGLALDGSNPTLLVGYGSYGSSYEPTFKPALLAWLERGGVYAIAHVRGGGEYGKEWHEAGRLLNKQNTIDDFVACGEYLIERGYASRETLAGSGRSAGGVVAGGGVAQRPDLWRAMIFLVADVNALRSEYSEGGPANIPEFGTVTTEEGYRALSIIDAYVRIADGTAYPAALVTTGVNDPRVPAWQAMKMAARLQAASSSGRPVLLRVDFDGGHGMGASRAQLDEELADQFAFLLWQLRP